MKAAVSIPDDVFEAGERLAHRLRTSRSQLYARALADFVVEHDEDQVTATLNRVLDKGGTEADEFTRRAAVRALRHVEWQSAKAKSGGLTSGSQQARPPGSDDPSWWSNAIP